jgi:hypothetical protein
VLISKPRAFEQAFSSKDQLSRDRRRYSKKSGTRVIFLVMGATATRTEQPVLELRTTDALITPYVTGNLFLFYAPLKSFDDQTAALLESNGLGKYVGPIKDDSLPSPTFQYDEQCWIEALAPSVCAAQYFTEAQRLGRGVLAFHDTDSRTLVMLQELVPQLKAFGFDLVRLDEIPSVRSALSRAGGQVDQVAGPQACDDYE